MAPEAKALIALNIFVFFSQWHHANITKKKIKLNVLVFPHCFFRKILRLVKHTLVSVSGVRDQEMALLDEMLAACAREASNKSLELIFSSHLFYQNRQEKFISSLAGTGTHPVNVWRLTAHTDCTNVAGPKPQHVC